MSVPLSFGGLKGRDQAAKTYTQLINRSLLIMMMAIFLIKVRAGFAVVDENTSVFLTE